MLQPCTDSQPNLRASQCAEFNSIASDGSAKVWNPLSMTSEFDSEHVSH